MATRDQQSPVSNSFHASDAARGVLITGIIAIIGYFAMVPAPAPEQGGFWITHTGLSMLLVGIVLQLTIVFGRPQLARYERANGLEGQLSPMAIHVLQLLADGVTVLLFALAVFGGISSFESGI